MSIWDLKKHDAPLVQMYGVHSEKDKQYWEGFGALQEKFPHSTLHTLTHWPVYTKRILMT